MCVSTLQLGSREVLELRGYEIASETIFGANTVLLVRLGWTKAGQAVGELTVNLISTCRQ